jgi:UDP-N-acetylglucosamine 2-epimerase
MSKKFTLVTFLGIRPDIIRTHQLLALLDQGQHEHGYRHIFVHSGQHFDYELDGVFYRELGVRKPDVNLAVGRTLKHRGTTSHVYQSGLLFERTAGMLEQLRPDAVLYLGDTNTVLSSIIVAKFGVPVIHIEGGGRSFDWRMPEEKNRITIDHLSDMIYCYLDRYRQILLSEGIPKYRVLTVGNIIVDALAAFGPIAARNSILRRLGLTPRGYALCTLHREENLDAREILTDKTLDLIRVSRERPVVLTVMPRLAARLRQYGLEKRLQRSAVRCVPPLGFLSFLKLEQEARVIITDSGTVQEEALILGVPCVVARRSTERPETIKAGATILADTSLYRHVQHALTMNADWDRTVLNPHGGSPSQRIYRDLVKKISHGFFHRSRDFRIIRENRFARHAYGHELATISN